MNSDRKAFSSPPQTVCTIQNGSRSTRVRRSSENMFSISARVCKSSVYLRVEIFSYVLSDSCRFGHNTHTHIFITIYIYICIHSMSYLISAYYLVMMKTFLKKIIIIKITRMRDFTAASTHIRIRVIYTCEQDAR